MKIVFISFSTATLLGLAFFLGGFSFDVSLFISSCFVASLLAWTISQYRRKPRPVAMTRPVHLPARLHRYDAQASAELTRLAA
ncbi:MAG TPA: hypothetical protein VGM64_15930 [Lacunisphaera sp.]|jgi:hypothetical protein